MALLDRFIKKQEKQSLQKTTVASESTDAKRTPATGKVKEKKEKNVASEDLKASSYAGLLLKPHVSEKAAILADRAIYVFDVPVTANKIEIGKAVEATYKVQVLRVRTQRGIGKFVRRGKSVGQRNAWKKALVELKKGQTINLIEGV